MDGFDLAPDESQRELCKELFAKKPLRLYAGAMTDETTPERPHHDLDARDLKALSHPVRMEMYDLLSQYGAQTASMLAARVGESSGVTSYHLRTLAKHGLIEEDPDRGNARERWWRRPRGSVSLGGPAAMATPAGRAASEIVLGEFYRIRHEQLMEFIRVEFAQATADSEPNALLSTSSVSLTKEQFDEFSKEIEDLVTVYLERYRDQEGEGVRRYSLRTDLFPLPDTLGAAPAGGGHSGTQDTHEGEER